MPCRIGLMPCSFLLCAAMLMGAPALCSAQPAPLKICHEDEDNHPWFIKNGKGASVVLMELAAARAGVAVVLEPMPWRRCLWLLEKGRVAGALGASYTEQRAAFAVYPMTTTNPPIPDTTRQLRRDEYSLYRAKGSPLSWNGKAFSGVSGPIAYQTSFSIGEQLRNWGVEPFDGSTSPAAILRQVMKGAVQGAALQSDAADHLLQEVEFSGYVEKVSPPLVSKSFYLAFGKGFTKNNQALTQALGPPSRRSVARPPTASRKPR